MTENTSRLSTALADRYLIERRLGEGGMATVYLAEDIKHKRKVAVKVLRPELAAVLGAERFVQEITTTANLQHPHILPLFDSGEADSFLFYVMPFIDGETLRGKLDRETQLGIDEAVRITREIADALDYAHGQGVIHRDIKPENILIQNGRPMVADFGIALAVSAAAGGRMTETGLSLGTPHYMSPEQATAEKDLTNRADIYSLGSMLYEMLTGEPPHMGNSAQQIIMKIVTDDARPVTDLRKSVPANVAAAVAKSLEKLAADRFESAAQFSEALGNTGFTVPGTAVHAVATTHRSRPRATLALAAACAALAVVAAWGWLRPLPVAEPIRYRIALSGQEIQPGLLWRDLALSPDGRTIVFSQEVDDERQLWIKTADRADAQPLSGTENGRAPAFSPDGEWIAFAAQGRLRKVPRLGGSAVTIADSVQTGLPAVAWLNNDSLLFNGSSWALRVVHQDGGIQRIVSSDTSIAARSLGVVSLAAGPGGQALVGMCNGGCARSALFAVDLASGQMNELGEGMIKGWFLPGEMVVFVRGDGGVFAAPFDAGDLGFGSPPIPILEGVRRLGSLSDIALAANGTLLFVPGVGTGGTGLTMDGEWVSRDGEVTRIDSSWTFEREGNGGLALSPDGTRLAVAVSKDDGTGGDIWVKELDRGPFTRLTFQGSNTRPVWSLDGRSVIYVSQTNGDGSEDVVRRRADGSGSLETLLNVTRAVFEVVPLRDTTQLLVRFGGPPTRDVYLADFSRGSGDSALVPLLAGEGYHEASISLSPDERWLAYTSDESGRYEVYVRPFPDVDSGRWQISRDGGNEPRWAPGGRELFYRTGDRDLVAVPVAAGPAFAAGQQETLFSTEDFMGSEATREYDVSPDGSRFVFLQRPGVSDADSTATATTAILVQNWLAEVEERLGGRD